MNDNQKKKLEWFNNHPELCKKPSMLRRKAKHDYRSPCIYLITLCSNGRRSYFGTLRAPDNSHKTPWIEPSDIGMIASNLWFEIIGNNESLKSLGFRLMPDHIHIIVQVRKPLTHHIGAIISKFKVACTQAMAKDSENTTEKLWESGYNDRILTGKGQLNTWIRYIVENPLRLWIKRKHPELFTVHRNITIYQHSVSALGNIFLLNHPYKVVVQCSRSLTPTQIEEKSDYFITLAREGAVLVSPCISRGEKEIMRRVFNEGFPQIILLENGFTSYQKPQGRQYDACARGQILLIAPWQHHNEQRRITREQCLQLNALAKEICKKEEAL